MSTPSRHRFSAAERARILAAYRRSDLTQQEFAAQAGIGYSTLTRWLRQAGEPAPAAQKRGEFVPVPNLLASAPVVPAYRLCWANGLNLELARGFDAAELERLLQLVRAQ
jgi:transposase-like protein